MSEKRCGVETVEERGDWTTHSGRIEHRQLVCRLECQLRKFLQVNASLVRLESAPSRKGGLRSGNGLVGVFDAGLVDGSDLLMVVRRRDIEGLSIRRLDELQIVSADSSRIRELRSYLAIDEQPSFDV